MQQRGLMDNTMVVFTADHGDYLGDHWMGEKDLFHDPSVKVPLIVYDPRPQADATRGMVRDELVEGIDLVPTFLHCFGGADQPHVLEGLPLDELLFSRDTPGHWRRYAISEYDYATREARRIIGNAQEDARLIMVRDARWKYIHAEGFRPMLFDLQEDPRELNDLGAGSAAEHAQVRQRLAQAIFSWARRHHNRITLTPAQIEAMCSVEEPPGILIGYWDEDEYQSIHGEAFNEHQPF